MSLISGLFKSKKTPSYQGIRPYESLLQGPGGKQYYDEILGRLEGRNVGFGDTYASQYANPIIQNSRQQFQDYTIPELTSELSATGRRRGSGGFDQVRRAYDEQANKEGDVFSRLQQRNEDAMREDRNNALVGLGDFNQRDSNTRGKAADFDFGIFGKESANKQYDDQRNDNLATNWLNYGSDVAGMLLSGGQSGGTFSRQAPQSPQMTYGGQTYATSQPPQGSPYFQDIFKRSAQRAKVGQAGGY